MELIVSIDVSASQYKVNGKRLKKKKKLHTSSKSILINFSDISTLPGLFHSKRLGNCIHYTFKSDLIDKMKRIFFQTAVVSILLYRCTTWTLTKRIEKKAWQQLHKNAASNIEQVLEATPLKAAAARPPLLITKTIKIRRTRYVGHCWKSRDTLIRDVLLWIPSHDQEKAGRPARTYIQHLCVDTECSPEDQPEAMDDREGWRERVRDICADGATW